MKGYQIMLDKLLDALRESIITQAAITVMVVGAWIYLILAQRTIPADLTQLLWVVVGFYFGSKVGYRQGEDHISKSIFKRHNDPPTIPPGTLKWKDENDKR